MIKGKSGRKGGIGAGRSIQQQLDAVLGDATPKRGRSKWVWFAGGGVILLAGLALYLYLPKAGADADQTNYREYTVQRGSITVGFTENSSISLIRESINFPVSATVEEVFVKEGSYVEKGEPVMLLNVEEIRIGLSSYELELEQAGLELEQAKLKQETGLLAAQQKYETAKQTGKLAGSSEDLTVAQLKLALETAKKDLESATREYNEYVLLNADYPTDYSTLCYYEERADTYKERMDDYNDLLTQFEDLSKVIATLKLEIGDKQAQLDELLLIASPTDDSTAKVKTLNDGIAAQKQTLSAKEASLAKLGDKSTLQSGLSSATSSYQSANETYTSYKSWYNEKYGNISDSDDLAAKVSSLQTQVSKTELALAKAELDVTTGSTSAEQKAESAETDASVAATELELTKIELQQAVDAAQEAYDALAAEIAKIKAVVSEDGLVYASCSGMVASVAFGAGDSFEVTYNPMTEAVQEQTLLTLTNIADVYVPITISEEDVLDVYIGQEASVTMTAFSGRTFQATVDTVSVESSRSGAATVSYTVNVRFADVNTQKMFEGMSAEVTLVQAQAADVLYINTQCVSNVGGKATVLVRGSDGEPMEKEVKTGFSDGRYVEILSGLSEGDTVLAESAVQP